MIRLLGRAALLIIVVSILLILPAQAMGGSLNGQIYSALLSREGLKQAYRLIDADRSLSFRQEMPFEYVWDAQLSWDDGHSVYVWQRENDSAAKKAYYILYRHDLISAEAERLFQEVRDVISSGPSYNLIQYSSDDQNILLLHQFRENDYYLLNRTTGETQLVLDLEPAEIRPGAIPSSTLSWTENGAYALVSQDILYTFELQPLQVKQFSLPDDDNYSPIWLNDGKRILLWNPGEVNKPILLLDVETGTYDPYLQTISATRATLSDDNRWLSYVKQSAASPTMTEHFLNLETGESLNLAELPAFQGQTFETGTIRTAPLVLITGPRQPGRIPQEAALRPFWLLNLETRQTVLLDEAAVPVGWIEDEQALVYAHLNPQRRYEVYKRAMRLEAEAVYLGTYEGDYLWGLWDENYTRMITNYSLGYSRGRIALVDIRAGTTTYFSPPGEVVLEIAPWAEAR